MAAPITWANIPSSSSRSLQDDLYGPSRNNSSGAGGGILDGFAGLMNLANMARGENTYRADEGYAAARQEFTQALNNIKTVEGLTDWQNSGQAEALRALMNTSGRESVLGAEGARETGLMQDIIARGNYNEKQVEIAERPLRDTVARLYATGKPGEAEAYIAANPGLTNQSTLVAAGEAVRRTTATNVRADAIAAQTDALRAIQDPEALRVARLNVARQPAAELDAALALTESRRIAADAVTKRNLIDESETAANKYKLEIGSGQIVLGNIARNLGLPLTAAGAPDLDNITKLDRERLNQEAKVARIRDTDSIYGSDTSALNQHLDTLKSKYSSTAIEAMRANITGMFDSSKVNALVGQDAINLLRQQKMETIIQAARDSTNRFAPGSPDARNSYNQLSKDLPSLVSKDAPEDIPNLNAMLHRFATVGLKVPLPDTKDMKGPQFIYITPSAMDIEGLIKGYPSTYTFGNFSNRGQADDIEKALIKMYQKEDVKELRASAERSKNMANRAALKAAMQPLVPPPSLNPNAPPAPASR